MAKAKRKRVLVTKHDIETEGLPSGSGFDADFRCLGKWWLERQINKPEKRRVDADRGDRIHEALKKSDLSELCQSDEITASRCIYAEGELVHELDFEQAEAEWEVRLWDTDDELRQLWSVKPDTVLFDRNNFRTLVINYKTGFGVQVPIKENWQVKAEAVAVHIHYRPREVFHGLIHPHHPDLLYEKIRFAPDLLDVHLETIRGKVAEIQKPNQPRTPNGISCQWCKAKGICPEYQAWAKDLAQAVQDEAEDLGFTAILNRTPEERGDQVKLLKRLQEHIKSQLEQYVKLEAQKPDSVKGWRLKSRWTRSVKNEAVFLRLVKQHFGENAANHALVVSLTALEAYLKKNMSAKKAEEAVKSALNSQIKYTKSESWLAPRVT